MSNSGLVTAWTAHCPKTPEGLEQKKRMEQAVLHSSTALSRLRDILLNGSRYTDDKWSTEAFIEAPDFAVKMAFELGKRAYAKHTLKLLSHLDPKDRPHG
jgi:hypothetical protein